MSYNMIMCLELAVLIGFIFWKYGPWQKPKESYWLLILSRRPLGSIITVVSSKSQTLSLPPGVVNAYEHFDDIKVIEIDRDTYLGFKKAFATKKERKEETK